MSTQNFDLGRSLPGAVKSVLAQHLEDVEVVVVDDGSTDGSGLSSAIAMRRRWSGSVRATSRT